MNCPLCAAVSTSKQTCTLACGHAFCAACVTAYIDHTTWPLRCPACRNVIVARSAETARVCGEARRNSHVAFLGWLLMKTYEPPDTPQANVNRAHLLNLFVQPDTPSSLVAALARIHRTAKPS